MDRERKRRLEQDAEYTSPNISKLMSSRLVYCAGEEYSERLERLRKRVSDILDAPFTAEDYTRANGELENAENQLGRLMLSDGGELRAHLAMLLYHVENAVCLLNKRYFKMGTRRFFEELETFSDKPADFARLTRKTFGAESYDEIRTVAINLLGTARGFFNAKKATLPDERKNPTAAMLSGAYEESFSNWRNKMYLAAEQGDARASFSAMAGFQLVWNGMCAEARLPAYDLLGKYSPTRLGDNAREFDNMLAFVAEEYERVGIKPVIYGSADEFVRAYLGA